MTYWQLLQAVREAQRLSDIYDELRKQLELLRSSPSASTAFLEKQIADVEREIQECALLLNMKVPNG